MEIALERIRAWLERGDNQRELDLSRLNLSELPELPQGAQALNCSENQLTQLGELPRDLQTLRCNTNQLTSLDNLPRGLQSLGCDTIKLHICNPGICPCERFDEFYKTKQITTEYDKFYNQAIAFGLQERLLASLITKYLRRPWKRLVELF